MMNFEYVATKYLDDLRDNSKWEVDAITNKAKRDLRAEIYPAKAYRARIRAANLVQGKVNALYHRLWDGLQQL